MGRVKELYFNIIQEYGSVDQIPEGLTISEFLSIINKKKTNEALENEIVSTRFTNGIHNNLCDASNSRNNIVH